MKRIAIYQYIFIAIGYTLMAWLGYLLIEMPTYGTLIFPASGFALAALSSFGKKLFPSIFAGSIILQIILGHTSNSLGFDKTLLYVSIASGAGLQALIGYLTANKINNNTDSEFESPEKSIKFFFFAVCGSTIISSSVGNLSLLLFGMVRPSDFFYYWMSWYAGDVLGIIIFYPVFKSIFHRENPLWKYRKWKIIFPNLAIFALLTCIVYIYSESSIKEQESRLAQDALKIKETISDALDVHEAVLLSLANFIEVMEPSDKDLISFVKFEEFAEKLLYQHRTISALSINDIVYDDKKNEFEKLVSAKLSSGKYEITERNKENKSMPAASNNMYVPVRYIVPLEASKAAIGFNIFSEPKRRIAIEQAILSNNITTTAPIKLVQNLRSKSKVGVLQLVPIKKKTTSNADRYITGFAVAVLNINDLIDNALRNKIPNGLAIQILDSNATTEEQILYQSTNFPTNVKNEIGKYWEDTINIGGRNWTVTVSSIQPRYLDQYSLNLQLLVLVIAIIAFILFQVFLLDITGAEFISSKRIKNSLSELKSMINSSTLEKREDKFNSLQTLADHITNLVSDNKKYIERIKDVSEAKTIFLTTMSHEIRTPLNALLGTVDVLNRTKMTADQYKMISDVEHSGRMLLDILNDILDFSKIESGKIEIQNNVFNIYDILTEIDSSFGCIAKGKGLSLNIESPENISNLLVGDQLRVLQILTNLVGNSIKFTSDGSITISVVGLNKTNENKQIIKFSVRDTGIGIDTNKQELLFTPFTQADGSITRRYGGSGLGLSICKRLVELMFGKIGVESELGHWSVFWFEIPFELGEHLNISTVSTELCIERIEKENLDGCNVMVVDDNELNRTMFTRLLSQEGARSITLAENGKAAIELLKSKEKKYDFILMDVQMPVMDGLTATKIIRNNLELRNLPIIICSAGVYEQEQQRALAAGANDFVGKPISRQILLKKIKPLLDNNVALVEKIQPSIFNIDIQSIKDQFGGDDEFVDMLLSMFVRELEMLVCELPHNLNADGARLLHKIRGSAGNLGIISISQSSRELEDAILNSDQSTDVLLENFIVQINSTLLSIKSLLNKD